MNNVLVLSSSEKSLKWLVKTFAEMKVPTPKVETNGLEGLKRLSEETFELVCIDKNLKFIDGWLAVKEIKSSEKIPNMPVILFGEGEAPASKEQLEEYGVNQFVNVGESRSSFEFVIHSTVSLFSTSGTIENKYSKAKQELMAQESDAAIEAYEELRSLTKKSSRSSIGLAQAFEQDGQGEKAEALVLEMVEGGNGTPASQILAVGLYLQRQQQDKACDIALKLMSLEPGPFYYKELLRLFSDVKAYEMVESICRRAVEKEYNFLDFYVGLARCLYVKEDVDGSLEVVETSIEKFGSNGELLNIQGACYRKVKAFDLAIEAYEAALKLNPKDSKVYFNMALCCSEMGEDNTAIYYLESCLNLTPDFARARNLLDRMTRGKAI